MKFLKDLDPVFVCLVLYLIKSVALPALFVDVAIISVISLVYLARVISAQFFDLKSKQLSDESEHKTAEREFKQSNLISEQHKVDIERQLQELVTDLSNTKMAVNVKKLGK